MNKASDHGGANVSNTRRKSKTMMAKKPLSIEMKGHRSLILNPANLIYSVPIIMGNTIIIRSNNLTIILAGTSVARHLPKLIRALGDEEYTMELQ